MSDQAQQLQQLQQENKDLKAELYDQTKLAASYSKLLSGFTVKVAELHGYKEEGSHIQIGKLIKYIEDTMTPEQVETTE